MKKIVLALGGLGLIASLAADVSLTSASYQEVADNTGPKGTLKWAPAAKVIPGTKIRYINTIHNNGNEAAQKLVTDNAIPLHMRYVAQSAACENTCKVLYSVDGGKSFGETQNLFVSDDGKKRLAKPSEYTNIRWTIDALGANQSTTVQYEAILK